MKMEEKNRRRESELFVVENAKPDGVISALVPTGLWSVRNASGRATIGVVLSPTPAVRK